MLFVGIIFGFPVPNTAISEFGSHIVSPTNRILSPSEDMGKSHIPCTVKLDLATSQMIERNKNAHQFRNLPRPLDDQAKEGEILQPKRELVTICNKKCQCRMHPEKCHHGGGSLNTPTNIKTMSWFIYMFYKIFFHVWLLWVICKFLVGKSSFCLFVSLKNWFVGRGGKQGESGLNWIEKLYIEYLIFVWWTFISFLSHSWQLITFTSAGGYGSLFLPSWKTTLVAPPAQLPCIPESKLTVSLGITTSNPLVIPY